MSFLFNTPKAAPAPIVPAPAPMKSDAEVQSEAVAARARMAAASGRTSTILTGADQSPAPTAQKILTGVN
jgi:hypothetical protein